MQQTSLELARLHLEFGSGAAIDDADRNARMTDPIAQFGRQVPLDLLAAEIFDARQDASNQHLGAPLREKRRALRDPVTRIAFAQMHLPRASIVAGGGKQQLFAQCPEAQEADAELALQSLRPLRLEAALDRVADVRRHIMKIRFAVDVPAHAFAVVLDAQVMLSLLLAARDDDRLRVRIDAVLDQLGDGFERIALRQPDGRDRLPVIANAQI